MDNLRPGNVTGNTATKAPQRPQILMKRKWEVVRVPLHCVNWLWISIAWTGLDLHCVDRLRSPFCEPAWISIV